jgi:hypothetical protein
VQAYEERPLGRPLDDGLWREYRDVLGAAHIHRNELRLAMASRIEAARAAHGQQFKVRHHAIAAMPISGQDKRSLYETLAFERKCAERRLRATIKSWRTVSVDTHPGSWKQFLAARAARGDQRALRRLNRQFQGPAIESSEKRLRALSVRSLRTSRGSILHNLGGGVRLRESAGSIELLGEARDDALEHLVRVAKRRFGTKCVTLLGSRHVQERLTKMVAEQGLEIAQERQR